MHSSSGGSRSEFGAALLSEDSRLRFASLDRATAAWPAVTEVLPLGGRLVVFDSKLIHEVTHHLKKSFLLVCSPYLIFSFFKNIIKQ